MSAKMEMELDPKRMLEAIKKLEDATKALSEVMEKSLGKDAVKAVEGLDKAAEQGATSIASRFKDLSKRIQEDLKTAFAVGQLAAGLKLADYMSQGAKEVFNLERAFDKLNTRLQLTGRTYLDFKNNIGKSVAATGQKLEDILPGVEVAAAKGKVGSPEQLTQIAKVLAQAKASVTGENTQNLASTVVDIIKDQGKKVTAENFKATLDAVQATRIAGNFGSATEAAESIHGIAKYGPQLGLSNRQMGGLTSSASQGGDQGQHILESILERATKIGGADLFNKMFGQDVFKRGNQGQAVGMDPEALKRVNVNRFGSQQAMEQVTGLTGASGSDFKLFLEGLKQGQKGYKEVIAGSNETAQQFAIASDNLATKADQYRESLVNVTRSIGDSFSSAINEFLKRNGEGGFEDLKKAAKTVWENKGTVASGIGISALTGFLAGGGARGLLSRATGTAAGVMEGKELQKAAGVTPVFVVNAAEIGGGKGALTTALAATELAGAIPLIATTAVAVAAMIGAEQAGSHLNDMLGGVEGVLDTIKDTVMGKEKPLPIGPDTPVPAFPGDPTTIKKAISDGMVDGHQRVKGNRPVQHINPSAAKGGAPVQ